MKAKVYFIYAAIAAVLSTLLFIGRNVISSFAITCIVAAVFAIAGVLTMIASARVRSHQVARVLTLLCSVAAVAAGVLLLVFSSAVATALPSVMGVTVAAAALWQAVVILSRPISAVKHNKWMLISPATLIGTATYLWLLAPESDPQAMTAMGVAAAILALSTAIEGFMLRDVGGSTQNSDLRPLDSQNHP